ncbi:MAG: hypothetical protein HY319_22495 [Armatimonadetes bacterium]|nr:hypothetical protein [Armatimonadota bacterium]
MDHSIHVVRFTPIKSGSHVVALAEIELAGMLFRGLKLERRGAALDLAMPGRRIAGAWQIVYEPTDPELARRLKAELVDHGSRRAA